MFLEPLAENLHIELVVSKVGNAMLLAKGKIPNQYSWAQYDAEMNSFHLITEDGEMQELGLDIHSSFSEPLSQTLEMAIVEVKDDLSYGDAQLVKFMKVGE